MRCGAVPYLGEKIVVVVFLGEPVDEEADGDGRQEDEGEGNGPDAPDVAFLPAGDPELPFRLAELLSLLLPPLPVGGAAMGDHRRAVAEMDVAVAPVEVAVAVADVAAETADAALAAEAVGAAVGVPAGTENIRPRGGKGRRKVRVRV